MISVDTWRAAVGDAALAAGADVINDAWGGADPELVDAAAQHGAAIICTHTGGVTPRTRPYRIEYDDVVRAAIDDTVAYAERAVAAGVAPESVVIDPAHDFGKNTFHSLELTRRLDEMVATGWPVLVSLSNKDFVGETLDLPVGERLTGTLAATAVCALAGARIYRVHEVVETRQTVDMVWTHRRPPTSAACDPGAAVTRTRVVLVPGVLALLPEYAGLEDPVAELRAACLEAVAWLGADVTVLADDQGARVAAHLLGDRSNSAIAPDGQVARPNRSKQRDRAGWTSLLVVGNGSARRTEKAPGHLDERAAAFDDALGAALRAGDLTGVDLSLATELWASVEGIAGLREVLRGETATVDYDDDPFGVQYWVMRWQCES